MRNPAIDPAKKVQWTFLEEDIEYFDWLRKINHMTRAEMLHALLTVYPQANIEKESKQACEGHSLN